MQDLKDPNDYIDLFFNEQWTNYALDNSDEIPNLLLELEKETHQIQIHQNHLSVLRKLSKNIGQNLEEHFIVVMITKKLNRVEQLI